jgi:putative SOS response-associated peptidase YedK
MPMIIPRELQDEWLVPFENEETKAKLLSLAAPMEAELMHAWPVARLKGKAAIGNVKEAEERCEYAELVWEE